MAFCRAETLQQLPVELCGGGGDNNILAVALEQMRQGGLQEEPDVLMVSKDINLRIKADVLGLKTEDYISEKVPIDALYSGLRELSTSAAQGSLEVRQNSVPETVLASPAVPEAP